MDFCRLLKSIEIDGIDYDINTDFRDILDIFKVLNDPDLLDYEKTSIALDMFYVDEVPENIEDAITYMFEFMCMGDTNDTNTKRNEKPLFDWEQDFNLIVAPINRTLSYDVRGKDYIHWWTFLSAFMEIGECTFNTYVGIRNKLNKHQKLEKHEKQILKEHRKDIILKERVDSTTQALINEIMGV